MEEKPIDDKEQINPNLEPRPIEEEKPAGGSEKGQAPIDYFIPPPINYLNSAYYQYLQGDDNPMKQLTEFYTTFDEKYEVNNTPPKIPPETPITH